MSNSLDNFYCMVYLMIPCTVLLSVFTGVGGYGCFISSRVWLTWIVNLQLLYAPMVSALAAEVMEYFTLSTYVRAVPFDMGVGFAVLG